MTIEEARKLTEDFSRLSGKEYTFAMIDSKMVVYRMKNEVVVEEMSVEKALCFLAQLRGW